MTQPTSRLAFSACAKPVNTLCAIIAPSDLPTVPHKSIHRLFRDDKTGKNTSTIKACKDDVTPVTPHRNPHYPQAQPLPPFINNLLIEEDGLVKTGEEASGAVFSPCMGYRYILTRHIEPMLHIPSKPRIPVCFLMLNPSTADASRLDPTIRRCKKFAEQWGGDRLVVVNIFAWRATRPSDMKRQQDPVGPANRRWIQHAVQTTIDQGGMVIAAWGGNGVHRKQATAVRSWLRDMGVQVYCLGYTDRDYQPRHPLFVPRAFQPIIFDVSR